MKNLIKKSASIIAASAMLLTGSVGASAANIGIAIDKEKPVVINASSTEKLLSAKDISAMLDYADDVISSYLNGDYDENDNISLSKPVKVYNTPMYYIFVLCDNEVIGRLEVTKYNGGFFSAFDYGIADSIKKSYKNGEDINFVNYNGNIYMYSGNGKSFCVDESSTVKPERAIKFDAPVQKISKAVEVELEPYSTVKAEIQLNLDEIFAYKMDENDLSADTASLFETKNADTFGLTEADKQKLFSEIAAAVAKGGSSTTANASYVANQKYNGKWVCWAACTAMMLNCYKGTNLTAYTVADKVAKSGLTANGSIDCVKKSYSLYGYTVNNTVSTAISGGEMYYNVASNKPVQINIKNDNGIAHAVTVYGVEFGQNTIKYKFIDPSRGSDNAYKQITYSNITPSQVTSLFNYTGVGDDGGSVIYTEWYRTYR